MANLTELVARLRFKLDDTAKEKFPNDEDLEQEIKDAISKHDSDYTVDNLPENEEYLIVKLASISCFYTLASRYAEDIDISTDGVNIKKSARVKNYLQLAEQLEEEYRDESGGRIQVNDMERYVARWDTTTDVLRGE